MSHVTRHFLQLFNRAEMMVVVLGDEEAEVNDRHRLPQTGMKGGACKICRSHLREPTDDSPPGGAKFGENLRDRAIVMGSLVRLAVLEIGCVQVGGAGVVIIQSLLPQG